MRTLPALLLLAAVASLAPAADLRFFDDAALHAVQFMPDGQQGWAVGDEGVVWTTIDGGKTWDRKPTGVRASLRSVHFINPAVGWVAGREELPLGAGSAGVVLVTLDSGETWRPLTLNAMPGLEYIHFQDEKVGYVAGDGSDQYPSGVFMTKNSGRTWTPLAGPRCPGWNAASFDGDGGALVGRWNRLASIRQGQVVPAVVDSLGGRNVRGVYAARGKRSVAVGQGGLILLSDDAGDRWSYPELLLPQEVLACWDLHAVHGAGKHVWAAGRPGSALLHSGDGGKTWEMTRTGQPLPINGLYFHDEKTGWAVGEMGVILATRDGGKTWRVQQQGGKRSAVLFVHAHSAGLPADTLAKLADEGYLTAAVRVTTADPTSAPLRRSGEAERLALAMRWGGGAAAESLWQLPLPAHLAREPRESLIRFWDDLHGGKAGEQVLRQLVLALRLWRPDVVVCDPPENADPGAVPEVLLAEAMREAFKQAADPKAFPEQIVQLGLAPWKPSKLYAPASEQTPGALGISMTEVKVRLQGNARDFAAPVAGLLAEKAVVLPRKRFFQLLESNLAGAEKHQSLMEGVAMSAIGDARRKMPAVEPLTAELLKGIQARQNVQTIVEMPASGLGNPDRLLGALPTLLEQMPDAQGALAAHAVASQFVRLGQWTLAREAYLQMVERYPTHPLTGDAYRWLIKHAASSEARRRHELGQFLVTTKLSFTPPTAIKQNILMAPRSDPKKPGKKELPAVEDKLPQTVVEGPKRMLEGTQEMTMPEDRDGAARWHGGALELEKHLKGFGPLLADDPALQFCLHAARRSTGDLETPRKWFSDFVARQPPGPWRDAAAMELWLTQRKGQPPRPVLVSRQTETRPFLDGKFDDACWREQVPAVFQDATGKTNKEYPTRVMLAHDSDFLYLALRCEHPPGKRVPPAKGRKRDEDLRAHDRVCLLLDMDRDYATCFQFEVDERGCLRESCWGDQSWDPRWFVAVHSDEEAWQIEAAIPVAALTGDLLTGGKAWCCNVIRTIPGKGVQAWSLPAGQPEEDLRLEGMGLLIFKTDPRYEAQRDRAGRMQRVAE